MFCFPINKKEELNENLLSQILTNIDNTRRDNIVSEYKINEKINNFEKNINDKINILIYKNIELIEKNNKLIEQNKILFDFIIEHFNKEKNIVKELDLEIKNKKNNHEINKLVHKEEVNEIVHEEEVKEIVQEEEVKEIVQEEVKEIVKEEVKKKRNYNRKKK